MYIKNYFHFVLCFIMAIALAYLISGSGGVFVAMLLLMAHLFSLAMLVVSVKSVDVSLSLSSAIVNRGDSFSAQLRFDKKTMLPSSFVEVTIGVTPNIEGESEIMTYKLMCAGLHGEVIDIPLKAVMCCGGEIRIEKIEFIDYLGMIGRKRAKLPEKCTVRILPRIPDTGTQTEMLRAVSSNISFDDTDEESDETSSALTGVPGYEHRQYIAGDPLKRVNWKLSSKKDQLMVRLDEKITSSSQIFRLDIPVAEVPDKDSYTMMDISVEGSLALLSMLVRSGYESEYNYCIEGRWEQQTVSDLGSLTMLQERLAGIVPYPAELRDPDHDINEKGKAMICFTACTGAMTKELAELADGFNGNIVIVRESGINALRSDMWSVDREFEFTKLQ